MRREHHEQPYCRTSRYAVEEDQRSAARRDWRSRLPQLAEADGHPRSAERYGDHGGSHPLYARLGDGSLRRSVVRALGRRKPRGARHRFYRPPGRGHAVSDGADTATHPVSTAAVAAAGERPDRAPGDGHERPIALRAARSALHLRELRRRQVERVRLCRGPARRRSADACRSTRCSSMAASGSARPT